MTVRIALTVIAACAVLAGVVMFGARLVQVTQ